VAKAYTVSLFKHICLFSGKSLAQIHYIELMTHIGLSRGFGSLHMMQQVCVGRVKRNFSKRKPTEK